MSILGDGASCAAGSNPLAQMNKYMSADRSLQREQQGPGAAGQNGSLRGGELRQLSQSDRQLYESMQKGAGPAPDSFRFEEFKKDLPPIERNALARGGGNWGAEFATQHHHHQQHQPQQHGPNAWAAEFGAQPSQQPAYMGNQLGNQLGNQYGGGQFGGQYGGFQPQFARGAPMSMLPQTSNAVSQVPAEKDSAKWEEEFSKIERASPDTIQKNTEAQTADAQADAQSDEEADAQSDKDSIVQLDDDEDDEAIIDGLSNPELTSVFEGSYPPNWNEMWDNINDGANAAARVRTEDFNETLSYYRFKEDNEYSNEDDPFALGVYMMDNGAKLSCAALCFEEAVKRDPTHTEAWARLGDAQAQNEKESGAIAALERAVRLDPGHEKALLNLAISYTNEGYDAAASQILEKWIVAKYPDIAELVPGEATPSRQQLHERVSRMFLLAAQRSVSGSTGLDADVQVGLGVLCYRNDDYTKAIDCFRSALSVRPNDASLWNRLGATLANASRPEEAIDAYHRALELRPSFVRSRYNLAVSCINIGCYAEAAENILAAISLHDTNDDGSIDFGNSESLVDTLRRVFFAMDRRDLIAKLAPGAKLNDFRKDFNF